MCSVKRCDGRIGRLTLCNSGLIKSAGCVITSENVRIPYLFLFSF